MKIRLVQRKLAKGSSLIAALLITALIGSLLAVYLTMVRTQNNFTWRSQAWNAAMPIIEAGLEDALTHLSVHGSTNLACDGWQIVDGRYCIQRNVGENFYVVTISSDASPVIISQGYVAMPQAAAVRQNFFLANASGTPATARLRRGVKVVARRDSLFAKGLVARGQINMNGNNVETDSFDSSVTTYSTGKRYDSSKAKDNGDVATNSGLVNSVNVGNANIVGRVSTGPGGSVSVGPNGAVGSRSWHSTGHNGIQPGYSTDDMNVTFPDVLPPWSGGAWTPGNGTVGGVSYDYVLATGNYQLTSLNMSGKSKLIVTGNAVLYVTGNVSVSGQAKIEVAAGGSLKLYVGGASASLGGNGIANGSLTADKFMYYGLPSNTSLSLSGNAEFTGVVYAPQAALSLSGGGSNDTDFSGASITKTVTLNGHYKFHYDEALKNLDASRGFVITSWNELTPSELAAVENYVNVNIQ